MVASDTSQTAVTNLESAFTKLLSAIDAFASGTSASATPKTTTGDEPTLASFLTALARQLERSPGSLQTSGTLFKSVA